MDGQTDQRETIIPHHYRVAWYKKGVEGGGWGVGGGGKNITNLQKMKNTL